MSIAKRVLLWPMAGLYILSGLNHFVSVDAYIAIMPGYLPWHSQLVVLSGVAELTLGIGVLIPATRVLAAWGLLVLLIAIFPANLSVALNDLSYVGGEPNTFVNWIRLPFQLVLIAWAHWYTKPGVTEPVGSPT